MATATLLAIGTEIVTGKRTDTNSAYLAAQLETAGIQVRKITALPDSEKLIVQELRRAKTDLIVTTGGLGPTFDDRTRFAVARAFHRKLITSSKWAALLKKHLAPFFSPELIRTNLVQAKIPQGAHLLYNHRGTACGFYLVEKKRMAVCLPGPPREMQPMFEAFKPKIAHAPDSKPTATLRTVGIAESELSRKLEKVPLRGVRAYPLLFDTEVHIQLQGETSQQVAEAVSQLKKTFSPFCYGEGDEPLEKVVLSKLLEKKVTLALAESCTGGLLAKRLTDIPGASAALILGIVAYSNRAKEKLLGVSPKTLKRYGAVSAPCAQEMAERARALSGASIALAITGIAGPSGGSREKPLGLTFLGLCDRDGVKSRRMILPGDRERVRKRASDAALFLLLETLSCGSS